MALRSKAVEQSKVLTEGLIGSSAIRDSVAIIHSTLESIEASGLRGPSNSVKDSNFREAKDKAEELHDYVDSWQFRNAAEGGMNELLGGVRAAHNAKEKLQELADGVKKAGYTTTEADDMVKELANTIKITVTDPEDKKKMLKLVEQIKDPKPIIERHEDPKTKQVTSVVKNKTRDDFFEDLSEMIENTRLNDINSTIRSLRYAIRVSSERTAKDTKFISSLEKDVSEEISTGLGGKIADAVKKPEMQTRFGKKVAAVLRSKSGDEELDRAIEKIVYEVRLGLPTTNYTKDKLAEAEGNRLFTQRAALLLEVLESKKFEAQTKLDILGAFIDGKDISKQVQGLIMSFGTFANEYKNVADYKNTYIKPMNITSELRGRIEESEKVAKRAHSIRNLVNYRGNVNEGWITTYPGLSDEERAELLEANARARTYETQTALLRYEMLLYVKLESGINAGITKQQTSFLASVDSSLSRIKFEDFVGNVDQWNDVTRKVWELYVGGATKMGTQSGSDTPPMES